MLALLAAAMIIWDANIPKRNIDIDSNRQAAIRALDSNVMNTRTVQTVHLQSRWPRRARHGCLINTGICKLMIENMVTETVNSMLAVLDTSRTRRKNCPTSTYLPIIKQLYIHELYMYLYFVYVYVFIHKYSDSKYFIQKFLTKYERIEKQTTKKKTSLTNIEI